MFFGRPLVYITKGIGLGLGLGLEHYTWSVCLGFGLEIKVLVLIFSHLSPKTWSSLPLELRLAPTLDTLRRHLKTYLFG